MTGGTITAVGGGVGCALLIVLVAVLAATNNRLARLRNSADTTWAQINVQLTRRYDLIPDLVDTVQRYIAHERQTLTEVMAARGAAMAAAQNGGLARRAEAEGELTRALGRLLAVAETYPDLRNNQHFVTLQVELTNTEDRAAYAQQAFNAAVQSYNSAVRPLPGFRARDYFQSAKGERGPVHARF
ncbi:LemA family protein [Paractinoplanes toevensis]|uniref:LemA family protein n=1 Tax=Paractinoplanes toevensis TaxID=571911 RepID=A0A919W5S5_9ACTN|nr:LemA family protein [Actinoplanes toevensis]GIM93425.1 LemA family protein [Actinoplanes toevensis]